MTSEANQYIDELTSKSFFDSKDKMTRPTCQIVGDLLRRLPCKPPAEDIQTQNSTAAVSEYHARRKGNDRSMKVSVYARNKEVRCKRKANEDEEDHSSTALPGLHLMVSTLHGDPSNIQLESEKPFKGCGGKMVPTKYVINEKEANEMELVYKSSKASANIFAAEQGGGFIHAIQIRIREYFFVPSSDLKLSTSTTVSTSARSSSCKKLKTFVSVDGVSVTRGEQLRQPHVYTEDKCVKKIAENVDRLRTDDDLGYDMCQAQLHEDAPNRSPACIASSQTLKSSYVLSKDEELAIKSLDDLLRAEIDSGVGGEILEEFRELLL